MSETQVAKLERDYTKLKSDHEAARAALARAHAEAGAMRAVLESLAHSGPAGFACPVCGMCERHSGCALWEALNVSAGIGTAEHLLAKARDQAAAAMLERDEARAEAQALENRLWPTEEVLRAVTETRDALRADLNRIGSEVGLMPGDRLEPGELRRMLAELKARAEKAEAEAAAMRSGAGWFVYDPGDGFSEFDTEAEAKAYAEQALGWLQDRGEWHEDTAALRYGMLVVVEQVEEVDHEDTPGGDFDYTCNYVLRPMPLALALDAGRALLADLVGLRTLMATRVEEIQALRAEVARLETDESALIRLAVSNAHIERVEAERDRLKAEVERQADMLANLDTISGFVSMSNERDALKAEVEKEAALRAELTEALCNSRAEVAGLRAGLRAARFIASGKPSDCPAEYLVRENRRFHEVMRARAGRAYLIALLDTEARPPHVIGVGTFSEEDPTVRRGTSLAVLAHAHGKDYAEALDYLTQQVASDPRLAWAVEMAKAGRGERLGETA